MAIPATATATFSIPAFMLRPGVPVVAAAGVTRLPVSVEIVNFDVLVYFSATEYVIYEGTETVQILSPWSS